MDLFQLISGLAAEKLNPTILFCYLFVLSDAETVT